VQHGNRTLKTGPPAVTPNRPKKPRILKSDSWQTEVTSRPRFGRPCVSYCIISVRCGWGRAKRTAQERDETAALGSRASVQRSPNRLHEIWKRKGTGVNRKYSVQLRSLFSFLQRKTKASSTRCINPIAYIHGHHGRRARFFPTPVKAAAGLLLCVFQKSIRWCKVATASELQYQWCNNLKHCSVVFSYNNRWKNTSEQFFRSVL
jgi:hypothetical protein